LIAAIFSTDIASDRDLSGKKLRVKSLLLRNRGALLHEKLHRQNSVKHTGNIYKPSCRALHETTCSCEWRLWSVVILLQNLSLGKTDSAFYSTFYTIVLINQVWIHVHGYTNPYVSVAEPLHRFW
jgi:hypothetical protein